eukprot:2270518-Alexandrium_andersonii.AAC.1
MSASLVGSEMCIRDRFLGSSSEPRTSFLNCSTAVRLSGEPGAPQTTSTPVSYTHLTLPTICSV